VGDASPRIQHVRKARRGWPGHLARRPRFALLPDHDGGCGGEAVISSAPSFRGSGNLVFAKQAELPPWLLDSAFAGMSGAKLFAPLPRRLPAIMVARQFGLHAEAVVERAAGRVAGFDLEADAGPRLRGGPGVQGRHQAAADALAAAFSSVMTDSHHNRSSWMTP